MEHGYPYFYSATSDKQKPKPTKKPQETSTKDLRCVFQSIQASNFRFDLVIEFY